MGLTPLSPRQQAAVDELVSARRLERVPVDHVRAQAFIAAAEERISQLTLLTSALVAYDLAYDAAHDAGESLLAALGYRTKSGSGQHEAVGRFLRSVLDSSPGQNAAATFDRLRRTRNRSHYSAHVIGSAEVALAERTARTLLTAVRSLVGA